MKEKDLAKFDIRTDLIIDNFNDLDSDINTHYQKKQFTKDIVVEEIEITKDNAKAFGRRPGLYKNISFKDITDSANYEKVLDVFIKVMKKMLKEVKIAEKDRCLIVGLGNRNSTPDAIGPLTLDNIIVTHHILELDNLDDKYRDLAILEPNVAGITGVDAKDLIIGLTKRLKPDFIIIIDSLKTTAINRIVKTIQISNTGIIPGSGVNNSRKELNDDSLKIPVIAIGVPTIIESTTIVFDTLKYTLKKIAFEAENKNNIKRKMAIISDYEKYQKTLNPQDKQKILGLVGNLNDDELKKLLNEVLNPLNYNLMVTPKEIDFLVEKISRLLSEGLNYSLHQIKRQK